MKVDICPPLIQDLRTTLNQRTTDTTVDHLVINTVEEDRKNINIGGANTYLHIYVPCTYLITKEIWMSLLTVELGAWFLLTLSDAVLN